MSAVCGRFFFVKCFSRQRFLLSKTYLLLFYVTVLSGDMRKNVPKYQTPRQLINVMVIIQRKEFVQLKYVK